MAIELKMPALSPTMEEGTLAKWLVKEGDHVKSGDILAEIETDKATMEFEAVDEGVISSITVAEGTDGVKVGTVIAVIANDGEDAVPTPSLKPVAPRPVETKAQTAPSVSVPEAKPNPSISVVANGAMQTLTLREALRDAMAEEMRRDDRVFVMGEEVAEYRRGPIRSRKACSKNSARVRVIDTPNYGIWICWRWHRGRNGWLTTHHRIHDL